MKSKEGFENKSCLSKDTGSIMHGQTERKYGDMPNFMGNYKRMRHHAY